MGYWNGYGMHEWGSGFPFWAGILPFFTVFVLWALFWKGLALWHSARRGEKWWFIALLLINTLGLLEIAYLFLIAKLRFDQLFSSEPRK